MHVDADGGQQRMEAGTFARLPLREEPKGTDADPEGRMRFWNFEARLAVQCIAPPSDDRAISWERLSAGGVGACCAALHGSSYYNVRGAARGF